MSGGHGPRLMPLTPSRWQWHKFKDMAHYYFMVGLIPVGLIVFYANVFIGPAKLAEIPEGYEPKQWEYCRVGIQRNRKDLLVASWKSRMLIFVVVCSIQLHAS
jgi:NADH dehydrogenase (ubiquinone) 1 beta subcomplex subunit 5